MSVRLLAYLSIIGSLENSHGYQNLAWNSCFNGGLCTLALMKDNIQWKVTDDDLGWKTNKYEVLIDAYDNSLKVKKSQWFKVPKFTC